MKVEREFAVYALLLVALAANPVWFFPHAEDPAIEYRAVEMSEETRFRYAERHPDVIQCYVALARTCALETAVLRNGTVVNDSDVETGQAIDYRYVVFSSGFYEPAMERSGTRVRLTLEPRTATEVVRNLSHPYSEASTAARKVVRRGTATLHREVPARDRIVRRNGTYYALKRTQYKWRRYPRFFPQVRWLMWLGTVPLSFAAMWRWSEPE